MGHDGMEAQAAVAGLPFGPRRMLAQARDVAPGLAVVVRSEKAGRLDSGKHRAVRAGVGELPDGGDLGFIVPVRQTSAGLGPVRAGVGGLPDRRAIPVVAATGVERPGRGANEIVRGPVLAERAAQLPVTSRRIALEDEGALLRTDQDFDALAHRR